MKGSALHSSNSGLVYGAVEAAYSQGGPAAQGGQALSEVGHLLQSPDQEVSPGVWAAEVDAVDGVDGPVHGGVARGTGDDELFQVGWDGGCSGVQGVKATVVDLHGLVSFGPFICEQGEGSASKKVSKNCCW